MPKTRLPLESKCVAGHHGTISDSCVILSVREVRGLWQIAGWDNFSVAAKSALKLLGSQKLGDYRIAQDLSAATVWRISPDKVLIESSVDLSAFASADLAVLNLSHARTIIKLAGSASRDLLAQLVAIDVTFASFKPGEFLQTSIHHVGVLVHCTGKMEFDIFVPGTWAEAIWDYLYDNALPHGLLVKEAA